MNLATALFGSPVPAKDLVVEVDHNFWDLEWTSDHKRAQKVVDSVTSKFTDWNLRASDDDSLLQVLQHEAESGGSVSHCVRSMANDETIIVVDVLSNALGDFDLIIE